MSPPNLVLWLDWRLNCSRTIIEDKIDKFSFDYEFYYWTTFRRQASSDHKKRQKGKMTSPLDIYVRASRVNFVQFNASSQCPVRQAHVKNIPVNVIECGGLRVCL